MSGFSKQGQSLCLVSCGEIVRIQAWGANSLRVQATKNSSIRDDLISALIPQKKGAAPRIDISDTLASITNGRIRAEIRPEGRIRFLDTKTNKEILSELMPHGWASEVRKYRTQRSDLYRLELDFTESKDERICGLGQHQHGLLDQKGAVVELIQRNMEVPIPFLLSSNGYGLLWNNPAVGRVECATNRTRFVAESSRQFDYWVTIGDTPLDILASYADATGHAPQLPSWASGFWQCKLRYQSQEEVLQVAREYKKRKLPLSTIVIDWFHWTAQGDWRGCMVG